MKFERRQGDATDTDWLKETTLAAEWRVYRKLADIDGIPKAKWFGKHGDNHAVLVMELLGPSIETLYRSRCLSGRPFALNQVKEFAVQMIKLVQYCHGKGIIHCDLMPDNFVVGIGASKDTVYLIDFGLSQGYLDRNGCHNKFRWDRGMKGTMAFASCNAHLGYELSRRDDMMSLGFSFAYLINGKLPWDQHRGLPIKKRQQTVAALKTKRAMGVFHGLPKDFLLYLEHACGLLFVEEPNYADLTESFETMLSNHHDIAALLNLSKLTPKPVAHSSPTPSPPSMSVHPHIKRINIKKRKLSSLSINKKKQCL